MGAEFDAFEASPMPMWVYDPANLRILAANGAMAATYGYPREALVGMSILELRPEEERPRLREFLAEASVRPDRGEARVWTHRHADGHPMSMAIQSAPAEFDGRAARLVVAHDVSEIDRAQERLRLIARVTGDAAYDFDIPTGGIWFSEHFTENFGYDAANAPRDLAGWIALVHPRDRARAEASLREAIGADVDSWTAEYAFQRGDGTYTEVLERACIQRDAKGRAVRMVGVMVDLRPQRLLSTRLRLLERAVEATGTGILIADASDRAYPIVYANPAFEQITGFSADETEGRPLDFLQAHDARQPGAIAVAEALRDLREVEASLQGTRRDGQPFSYEVRITPMRDARGHATHLLGVFTDITERQRHAQQLAWRSTHDVLTGLPNRHLMLDRINQAAARVQADAAAAHRLAVLVVDLDEFKLVNDGFGHAAGDQVLCEVATRLRRLAGPRTTLARSVGDEFAILVEDADELQAELLASAAHAALAEPIHVDGRTCKLSACVGYAHYPDDTASADSLLMCAEMAMDQAKRQGRNATVAYRAGRMPLTTGKLQLLQELREALERREFRLLFQPIFSTDLRLVALEALVRWQHPERGLLPPSEFITVCEESGLIVELGRRVLREAALHREQLVAAGLAHVRIAVNVSARHFAQGLLDDVRRVVAEYGLPHGTLELELTESVILDDPARAAQVMAALEQAGVHIAIDDFGMGYSSLSYLKRLPLHRLKIDRSFVNDLESDVSDRSICEAIIALARTLGLDVVAEGVESAFQRDWLRGRGVGELQGYLFARPLPFDEAIAVRTHVPAEAGAMADGDAG